MNRRKKITELLQLASQPDPKPIDISPERLTEAVNIALSDPELLKDKRVITALNILGYDVTR